MSSPRYRPVLLALLCLLPALAWSGWLEDFSADYVDHAFTAAGLIYATARGINALVSVLQGTELDVVFVTVAAGEVLDPINDLIERFSGVVLIALGSLALQKILLSVVSHAIFNTLLTLLAAATALALWSSHQGSYRLLLRGFMVAAFLRLSLGIVVLANSWVDYRFLEENDRARHAAMTEFQGELRQASAITGINVETAELTAQASDNISRLTTAQDHNREEQRQLALELTMVEARLQQAIRGEGLPCTPLTISRHTCSDQVLKIADDVARLEQAQAALAEQAEAIRAELAQHNDNLECLQKQSRGESCGWFDQLSTSLSPRQFQARIARLESGVSDFAQTTIDLLMSLLLKSVVIPIVFFYLLLRVVRAGWSRFP